MKEALFASPAYAEQYGLPHSLQALNQHKLIQYRFIASNMLAPLKLGNQGETITIDMPLAMVCNDTDLMVDAALKGLGIGRIVEPMVRDKLESGQLLPVLQQHWQPYPGLYLYFHQHTQRAKRVRVLIDFLLEKYSVN